MKSQPSKTHVSKPPSYTTLARKIAPLLLKSSEKHLVLWYASKADNETGSCWASNSTIKRETGYSRETVRLANDRLQELGVLTVKRGFKNQHMAEGRANTFYLHSDVMKTLADKLSALPTEKAEPPSSALPTGEAKPDVLCQPTEQKQIVALPISTGALPTSEVALPISTGALPTQRAPNYHVSTSISPTLSKATSMEDHPQEIVELEDHSLLEDESGNRSSDGQAEYDLPADGAGGYFLTSMDALPTYRAKADLQEHAPLPPLMDDAVKAKYREALTAEIERLEADPQHSLDQLEAMWRNCPNRDLRTEARIAFMKFRVARREVIAA